MKKPDETSARDRRIRIGIVALVGLAILLVFRNYYGITLLFEDANLQWDPTLLPYAIGQLFHSWAPSIGAGRPAIVINETYAPIDVLQAVFAPFGTALSTLLLYPFLLGVGYAGTWISARKLSGSALAAHVVAIFVATNPWIWDRILLGHIAIFAATAVASWIVAAIVYRERLGRVFAPAMVGLCGLLLACDARIAYIVFVGLFVLVAFWVAGYLRARAPKDLWPSIAVMVAPFAAFALNAWWSLPFALIPGIDPVREHYPALDEILSFSQFSDVAHNLVFSGTFLHFSWDRAAAGGPLAFFLWFVALASLVIVALLARPRSVFVAWTLRVGVLLSFLLSFGTSLTPPAITFWFYAHVPFAMFFRDPNKFGYVGVTCCAILLCILLRDAKRWLQIAIAVAVVIAGFPVATGSLQTSIGAGFQAFPEHDDYVAVLHYLRSRPEYPNLRLGTIPPWTIETVIGDAHPVVEPFMFQYQIATMDAKAATIASDANMEAWRVYGSVYDGTDPHAGEDLARLGIGYLLWDENAAPSPGAQFSEFGNQPAQLVARAVAALHFPEVFRSGSLHIYRNPAVGPMLRTIGGPVIAGPVAPSLRAALPLAAIGDTVETTDPGALGLPVYGIGTDAEDACRTQVPRSSLTMAYDRASDHSDWTTYWVDSDYPQQFASDPQIFRELARYPLPYALTNSNARIDLPVVVAGDGRIAVEGAVLSTPAVVQYAVDGGARRTLSFSTAMRWLDLGSASPGPHVVSLWGSRVGTVLRAATGAALPHCGAPYLRVGASAVAKSATGGWVLPSILSMVTVDARDGRFSFRAQNANGTTRGTIDGPRADALTIDGRPVPIGVPLALKTGRHGIWLFGKGAPTAASHWQHWLAGASSGEPPVDTFAFSGAYDGDEATVTLTGVPVNSTVVARVPYAGDPSGAEVYVTQGATVTARFPLGDARTPFAITAYNDTIVIHVRRTHPAGALRLLPLEASAGVVLLAGTADISNATVPLRAGGSFAPDRTAAGPPVAAAIGPDDRQIVFGKDAWTAAAGAGSVLAYRGLRASEPVTCTLVALFETEIGLTPRVVADIPIGTNGSNGSIDIPSVRLTTAVSVHLECPDAHAILSADALGLRAYRVPHGAVVVERPVARRADPVATAIASTTQSSERFTVAGSPATVVSLSSYDPAWRFENNRHVLIDGVMNGWLRASGSRIDYAVQDAYVAFLWLSTALWLGLFGWLWVALRRR